MSDVTTILTTRDRRTQFLVSGATPADENAVRKEFYGALERQFQQAKA